MSWLLKNIADMISDLITGMLDFFNDIINGIFITVASVNVENVNIVRTSNFTMLFGIALITLLGVKQYFTTYVLETGGDPDADPLDILVRCTEAVAVCCANSWIFNLLMRFSKDFASDLIGSVGSVDIKLSISNLLSLAVGGQNASGTVFLFLLLMIVIGLIVFYIIAGIRGAELGLMKILFPIFSVNLVTANREIWNGFLTSYIMTFLYYTLQLLSFRMFSTALAQIGTLSFSADLIITLGWFIIMLRSPKWLEKFCYSSGLGRAAGSVAHTAPFLLLRR